MKNDMWIFVLIWWIVAICQIVGLIGMIVLICTVLVNPNLIGEFIGKIVDGFNSVVQ